VPRRSSLADRIDKGAGADAFTATEPIVTPEATAPTQPRRGRKKVGAGWEASNKPVTFYCPLDIYAVLMTEAGNGERSKSQIIADALRAELSVPEPGGEP
jgi:hypothetical protein